MKEKWRDALIMAVIAALAFEFVWNALHEKTLWDRVEGLEHRVQLLENRR